VRLKASTFPVDFSKRGGAKKEVKCLNNPMQWALLGKMQNERKKREKRKRASDPTSAFI